MQSGTMPLSEFKTILDLAQNPVEFDHALSRLNQDGRIIKFLDLFNHKTIRKIPKENLSAIIAALLDSGDLFPENPSGSLLSLNTPMRIHRIIQELLQRITPSEQRFIVLQDAISRAYKSIYIIVHELREQSREHLEHEDTFLPEEFRALTSEELLSLHKLCVKRIQYWASHGSLAEHPRLILILYAWLEWGTPADCRNFVLELTQTDRGIIAFLVGILDKAIAEAMTHYEINPGWVKYLEDINDFISPDKLDDHAKLLFEDDYFEKLREREQLALMIFLDLMKSSSIKEIRKTTAD
jgi:predicted KAP-like P-loop ATPase